MHGVTHLRIVKRGEAKCILRTEIAELHIEFAAGDQLAADDRGVS